MIRSESCRSDSHEADLGSLRRGIVKGEVKVEATDDV